MDFFKNINSQPWVRPGLGALGAIAALVKTVCPPYTIAGKVADFVLTTVLPPLAAYSVGVSHDKATDPK